MGLVVANWLIPAEETEGCLALLTCQDTLERLRGEEGQGWQKVCHFT